MANVAGLRPNLPDQDRVDLAAAFRLAARFGWHEAVANHFSLAIGPERRRVLINPRWKHFARIRAGDLLELSVDDPDVMRRPDAPDPTAWCIHGTIHKLRPDIRCLLHVHAPYATALVALEDSRILPIDQNTARFALNVAYDDVYEGLALAEEEGRRLAGALGAKRILMMANHGVLVTGESVAQAFDDLYYLERACQTLVLAYGTGRPLRIVPDEIAARVAAEWDDYRGFAEAHFAEQKALLDAEDPSYAT